MRDDCSTQDDSQDTDEAQELTRSEVVSREFDPVLFIHLLTTDNFLLSSLKLREIVAYDLWLCLFSITERIWPSQ